MLHCQRNLMKIALAASVGLLAASVSAGAADPTGDWRVADGVANIQVSQCGGSLWDGGLGEATGRARQQ